ncbi:ATP-binding protein [Streptomyces sp. NPDC001970]
MHRPWLRRAVTGLRPGRGAGSRRCRRPCPRPRWRVRRLLGQPGGRGGRGSCAPCRPRPLLRFIAARENAVFLGPPGTGKTHVATGLAVRACQAGHRVAFATAAQWVDRLAAAHQNDRLQDELVKLGRYPLIVIDLCRARDYAERGVSVAGCNRCDGCSIRHSRRGWTTVGAAHGDRTVLYWRRYRNLGFSRPAAE